MKENKYIIDFREVKYYLEMHGVIWKALVRVRCTSTYDV